MVKIMLLTLTVLTVILYIAILVKDRLVIYKKWGRFKGYSDEAILKKAFYDEIAHQTTCAGIIWPILVIFVLWLTL